MTTEPTVYDLPKRVPLSVLVAGSLRKMIEKGIWTNALPSERRLCRVLQVSRPTLRTALHMLAQDGWLEIRRGRRNRLRPPSSGSAVPASRIVALVTPTPVSQMALMSYHSISELRGHLADQGYTTDIIVCPGSNPRERQRKLETFLQENRVGCCVLWSVNRELQQWCSDRSVPAVVFGSCHPEVRLPSVGIDYHPVCRHAVGVFLRRGHRRMALVVPNSGMAGDLASERGFKDGLAASTKQDDADGVIVRHNGTAQNITQRLDALFNSARPPTALLVAKPWDVFAVIIYLLKRGLAMPDAVSLIARDHDHLFESVVPTISHYRFDKDSFVQPLTRHILKLLNGEVPSLEPSLVYPRFIEGGTVSRRSR